MKHPNYLRNDYVVLLVKIESRCGVAAKAPSVFFGCLTILVEIGKCLTLNTVSLKLSKIYFLKCFIKSKRIFFFPRHNTCFLVFADAFFKEICFALQRNHVHPIERISRAINFWIAQRS